MLLHIVFIVGSYYPNYSAVGKCVGNIADEISKDHKVTVICSKSYLEQHDKEIFNGQQILRVITKEKEVRYRLDDNVKSLKGFKKRIYEIYYKLYKVSRIIKTMLSNISIKKEMVAAYIKALNNINEPIDVVIPASMPFESVVAAIEFKKNNPSIKVIPYLFDQFVENESLHRFKFNKYIKRHSNMKKEREIIQDSDTLLIMKQLEKYYQENYNQFIDKFNVVEHPLLRKSTSAKDEDILNLEFIYAGSFYKGIREPEYMIKTLDNVLDKLNATLNLYVFGNCDNIINEYTQKNKRIKNRGKVTTQEVYKELERNTFLIAVGNQDNKQVPSKIFEYLSFGKPIIYFYTNDQDMNLKVMNDYPLGLCIKQDYKFMENNIARIIEFCSKSTYEKLEFNEVEKLFPDATPKYTVKIIEKMIKRDSENL